MKNIAVIGAGFGDEGKGLVTDWLCSQYKNPLVVRFCGGQQAGHMVRLRNGLHHIFSNFGSGTLREVDTYWSEFCTFDPIGIINELTILNDKGVEPHIYINKNCPVTTPFDMNYNIQQDSINNHGTCGLGIGQTIQREEDHYRLRFEDLFDPIICKLRLMQIIEYYAHKSVQVDIVHMDKFLNARDQIVDQCLTFNCSNSIPNTSIKDVCIFEGSQGLLLDQNYGFFPHVTRGNTGIKNILKMNIKLDEIYFVTRAYQTRHGNGPMTNRDIPHNITSSPWETNNSYGIQGEFRKSLLDLNLLTYAVRKEVDDTRDIKKRLVITCLDHVKEDGYRLTFDGKIEKYDNRRFFLEMIKRFVPFEIFTSEHPFAEEIQKF